jgi:hypothetical protein
MGFMLGFGLMVAVSWLFHKKSPRQADKLSRRLQLLSTAAYSLGHGGNDAQKTMGIVAGALYTDGVMNKIDFSANWGTLALANHPCRPHRDFTGHLFRWMAHGPHHGLENHQAQTCWWLLRGNRRRHHTLRHGPRRNSCQYYPTSSPAPSSESAVLILSRPFAGRCHRIVGRGSLPSPLPSGCHAYALVDSIV